MTKKYITIYFSDTKDPVGITTKVRHMGARRDFEIENDADINNLREHFKDLVKHFKKHNFYKE